MNVPLTAAQRTELQAAATAETRKRPWKRYQAVLLLADGQSPATVAHSLGCGVSSVFLWAAKWRRGGVAGLAEGPHPGAARRLDATGEALLEAGLAAFRRSRVDEVFLEVRESNTSARALYARHGFRPVGQRSAYYRNPKEDAVVLRLELSQPA